MAGFFSMRLEHHFFFKAQYICAGRLLFLAGSHERGRYPGSQIRLPETLRELPDSLRRTEKKPGEWEAANTGTNLPNAWPWTSCSVSKYLPGLCLSVLQTQPRSYWVSSASTVGKINKKIKIFLVLFPILGIGLVEVARNSLSLISVHPLRSPAPSPPALMPFLIPGLQSPTRREAPAKLGRCQPPCWRPQGKMYPHRGDGEARAKDGGGMSARSSCLSLRRRELAQVGNPLWECRHLGRGVNCFQGLGHASCWNWGSKGPNWEPLALTRN